MRAKDENSVGIMWSKTGTQSPRSSFLSYQSKLSLLHLLLPFSFILKVCREISSENSPDFFQSYPKMSLTLPFFCLSYVTYKILFFSRFKKPILKLFSIQAQNHHSKKPSIETFELIFKHSCRNNIYSYSMQI